MRTIYRGLASASLLIALASLGLAGAALAQSDVEVTISDRLQPRLLEVSEGTTVTWRNEDDERHRIRSREGPVEFDSGNLEPGERFSVTLAVAGEYPYRDERNDDDPAYRGTIIVTALDATDGPSPMAATVTLIDETFQPSALEVGLGATVRWDNVDGDDDHTVTSTSGVFDSGILPAGEAFEHTFDTPGTFDYFCAIHPEMKGLITVGDGAAGPASVAAAGSPDPAIDGEPGTTEPAADGGGTVSVVNVAFDPADIEVSVGSTVSWSNDDPFDHTVTASDGAFDSGVMGAGDTFSRTFDAPGSYDYFCAIHPSMTGTVTVIASEEG